MNHSKDTSASSHQPPLRLLLIASVFLPFAAGFFLSYLYRTINAVLAPDIAADTGLSASNLGLLTSMYFLAFAAFQLPLGILLDRFGPRRVEFALLLIAALGALLFAQFDGLAGLALGRALIGVGVSCCLMAGFKAFALWFPADRIPLVNGFMMTFGGLGALASTVPVEMSLEIISWRGLFIALGITTAVLALAVLLVVPEHPNPVTETRLRDQFAGLRDVFRDRFFWRLAPTAAIMLGASLSVQSLWLGPWLSDVQHLNQYAVASHLMLLAATMGFAYPVIGTLAQRLARAGLATTVVAGSGMTGFMFVIAIMASGLASHGWALMIAFGFLAAFSSLSYALLGQHFPPQRVGRANTAMNVLIFLTAFAMQWALGAIIDRWASPTTGHYAPTGYLVGLGLLATLQLMAMLWFFYFARNLE